MSKFASIKDQLDLIHRGAEEIIPIEELEPDKDLFDDLGMDSLDLIEIINQTDEFTGSNQMELDDFSDCRTIKDFSDRFTEGLAKSVPQG